MTTRDLAGEPAQTLGYSYDRRLMTVTSSAGTTSFAYDVDGNRVLRDDGATTTVYLPHGFEHSTDNTTGARTARKTTSVAGRAIGTQESFFANPVPKWLYTNHQGSVAASYDPATGVVDRNRYDPWGAERTTAVSGTDIGYTGQRNDNSTGLMYYKARYYDPTIGRFAQTDTIIPDPAEPEDLNRYTYVRNNPTNHTDPTGHYCIVAGPRKGECIEPGDHPGDTGVPGTGDRPENTPRGSGGRGSPSGGAASSDDGGCNDVGWRCGGDNVSTGGLEELYSRYWRLFRGTPSDAEALVAAFKQDPSRFYPFTVRPLNCTTPCLDKIARGLVLSLESDHGSPGKVEVASSGKFSWAFRALPGHIAQGGLIFFTITNDAINYTDDGWVGLQINAYAGPQDSLESLLPSPVVEVAASLQWSHMAAAAQCWHTYTYSGLESARRC